VAGESWFRPIGGDAAAHERQRRFLAAVAHDLRSPLAVIQGYTGLLATGKPGPLNQTQREFLGGIEAKIVEVTQLLDDFLDLIRLESGAVELRREPVAVGEIADRVVESQRRAAAARRVQLRLQVEPADLTLAADPLRLYEILDHLGGRAIADSVEGGWVLVAAQPTAGGVSLRIADSGPGLSADERARLLEPSGERGSAGTDLTFRLVQRLVDLHGGAVTVDSEAGAGFAVTIHLPGSLEPPDGRPAADR